MALGISVGEDCATMSEASDAFWKAFARAKKATKKKLGGDQVVKYVSAYTAWMCMRQARQEHNP